jgi:hypothetical protein
VWGLTIVRGEGGLAFGVYMGVTAPGYLLGAAAHAWVRARWRSWPGRGAEPSHGGDRGAA